MRCHLLLQSIMQNRSPEFEEFIENATISIYSVLDNLMKEMEFIVRNDWIELVYESQWFKTDKEAQQWVASILAKILGESERNATQKDLEYLLKMKAMDEDIRKKRKEREDSEKRGEETPDKETSVMRLEMSEVVPIAGLLMARLHLYDCELRTVLEIWGRKGGPSPDKTQEESAQTVEMTSSREENLCRVDVGAVGGGNSEYSFFDRDSSKSDSSDSANLRSFIDFMFFEDNYSEQLEKHPSSFFRDLVMSSTDSRDISQSYIDIIYKSSLKASESSPSQLLKSSMIASKYLSPSSSNLSLDFSSQTSALVKKQEDIWQQNEGDQFFISPIFSSTSFPPVTESSRQALYFSPLAEKFSEDHSDAIPSQTLSADPFLSITFPSSPSSPSSSSPPSSPVSPKPIHSPTTLSLARELSIPLPAHSQSAIADCKREKLFTKTKSCHSRDSTFTANFTPLDLDRNSNIDADRSDLFDHSASQSSESLSLHLAQFRVASTIDVPQKEEYLPDLSHGNDAEKREKILRNPEEARKGNVSFSQLLKTKMIETKQLLTFSSLSFPSPSGPSNSSMPSSTSIASDIFTLPSSISLAYFHASSDSSSSSTLSTSPSSSSSSTSSS